MDAALGNGTGTSRMRIAFIVNSFPVVSETFILGQMVGLLQRGHQLEIIADPPARPMTKIHPDVERFRLLDQTQYRRPAPVAWGARLQSAASRIVRWGWRDPASILESLNIPRYGREALNLSLLHRWFPTLKAKQDYDIIHCHFGPNGQQAVVMRTVGALRGPILTTFYGYDISLYVRQHGPGVYQHLFARGDFFTSPSEYVRRRLIAAGCPDDKAQNFKLGTNLKRFCFKERKAGSRGTVRLITVARLTEKKGLEYSIRAVAKLSRIFKRLEYNIIGDGDLRPELTRLIEALAVGDTVHLLGWKTQEEVRALLDQSHVFMLASVESRDGDIEGSPLVLQEAQAMGLPVVSTRHSGNPEGILEGKSGFIVPERDGDALSERLAEIISRPETWPEMGRQGRTFVETEHDLDERNDALVELYCQVRERYFAPRRSRS
jgi:colanic acid/amylovoran biosynthesis glycosyltransferase